MHRYVLVTAAFNEADHIRSLIDAVAAQSMTPDEWIVVSDGSTDGTDEIVQRAAESIGFLRYLRRERDATHDFSSKVEALTRGIAALETDRWGYLGVLDADIEFGPDYFERLLANFDDDPGLGICGGHIVEIHDGQSRPQSIALDLTVAGATQMFRRECFEQVGGFVPLPYGGEDAAAEITARSAGWRVRTDPRLPVRHFGLVGRGSGSLYRARWRRGIAYRHLGYHPVFELARTLSRLHHRPAVSGSLLELAGYGAAVLRGEPIRLPAGTVAFLRTEQLRRLHLTRRHS